MAYREDEEKRIYELETAESLSAGTFVPVDKEGNEMAEKFDLGQLKADLETAINKNSGQLISLQYTDMEGWTLPDGITWRDVAERATCSTVNNSMVCQSAGFIQYPGSERFFQINYRGAVYSDSRSEYEDFLSVYLDPETYEVLNTVKGKRSDVVGILHDNDGSYSIEVLKNGEYVTGTDAYNWLNNYNIFSIITQTDRLFYPTGSTAYNQPLVYTSPIFSDGSYIIVKVKSDGSVEYEYKSKKVDAPSTAPEAGQVLTFNGTENTWANPPKGIPSSTAQDQGKVLTVDSNGGAVWGQSGFVVTLTEDLTTSPSTLSIDKTFTEINTAIQSSQSIKFNYDKKSPIGTVRVFSGSDVQTVYGSYIAFNCVSSAGKVTSVQLKVDDTVSIVESNNLPTSTSSDEGKVLTVDSNGAAAWTAPTVRVFTGTYNPDASPADYSGLPDQADVLAAINAGKDVVLMLMPTVNAPYLIYRLSQKFQYTNQFLREGISLRLGNIPYRNCLTLSYAGPDNPWTWSGGNIDISYTAEFTYWAASKPLLSDMRAEREAGKAVFLVCGEDVQVGNYWLEKGTVLPLTLDTQRPGYATMSLEFACTGVFKGQDCVTVRCVVNGDNTWEWHAYIHPKSSAIAPEYDSTATYAVGDAVMHNGLRYECNTAISTAEAWDSTHWTETSIENVIGNVETLLAAL